MEEDTMLIADYVFLGLGGAIACLVAFGWEEKRLRPSVVFSLIAGVVCGLSWCLNVDLVLTEGACILFLIVYILVVMQYIMRPEGTRADTTAVISIACACFGVLRVLAGAFIGLNVLSLFFRVMLTVVAYSGVAAFAGKILDNLSGAGWEKAFMDQERKMWMFPVFGVSLSLPMFGDCTLPAALLEIFSFFAGLSLFSLMIRNYKGEVLISTEKQYRDEMQTYMSVIRSQRHDYNFHVQTLHGLLLKKDYAGCERYLDELLEDSVAVNSLLTIEDAAVSALILSFQRKAAQEGIGLTVSIENNLSQIATKVYETNKIIGNLLQNALDEAETLPDKSYGIHLTILKRGEFALISVSNETVRENPMEGYKAGTSSKTGHEGIGIASIQALASRYGGVVYSRMEGNIIYFVAKIPLRVVKEKS